MLAAALPARATDPTTPLQPSSRWRIDYAESECRLIRVFGTAENAITLRIVRRDASDTFDGIIAGPAIPHLPHQVAVTATLEPQNAEQHIEGYSFAVPKTMDRYISWNDASAELFDQFQPDQVVRLAAGNRFAVRLRLTEARAALAAMDTCYTDMLKGWGVDPASWVSWADYPAEALRQEIEGAVVMALTVGISGRIDACRVIISSKSALLDERSCQLLTLRARYEPGKDTAGKAVPSTTIMRVRWNIPSD